MDKATYDRGLEIRKSVLGSEFVDKAIASADEFNRPMQDLTTEYCWGYVWGREGLTRKTRSLPKRSASLCTNRSARKFILLLPEKWAPTRAAIFITKNVCRCELAVMVSSCMKHSC